MSEHSHSVEGGRRTCIKCELPAVEALRLDESTRFPVPLCRNHVRKARRYEADRTSTDRQLQRDKIRAESARGFDWLLN